MKCPKCGFETKPGRPQEIDRAKVLKMRKQGFTLRYIANVLGVSHGAVARILKGVNMSKVIIGFLLLNLASSCASGQLVWKPAPEKDVAATQVDITKCQRASVWATTERSQIDFFYKCMYSMGHTLVNEE